MQNKSAYVLSLFRSLYALSETDIELGYDAAGSAKVQIKRGRVDYFQGQTEFDPGQIIYKLWKGVKLPFLFDYADAEILEVTDGRATVNFDIIASSFFFLSGWQEYASNHTDSYGRFPYKESLQAKCGLVGVPVVNYYFDILKTAIEAVYPCKLLPNLWPEHRFVTCLTHDIDKCQSAWFEGGLMELRHGRFASTLKLILRRLSGRDAWFNFDEILEILRHHQARSTFYFLCRRGSERGVANADYDITRKPFPEVLARIKMSGSDVGVHGSFGTHESAPELRRDIDRLECPVQGNRFHFLAFDVRKSPTVLELADLTHDTTLGFAEHYGFRNGICCPFYLYDVEKDHPTSVLEIPLNLMDTTLHHTNYLGLKPDQTDEIAAQMINEIKKFGGCFTVLWHNTHFSRYKYAGWQRAFVDVLALCKEQGATFLTTNEVAAYFQKDALK